MERNVNLARNKLFRLEGSMIMYGIYNAKTAGKIIQTINKLYNKTTYKEILFAAKI